METEKPQEIKEPAPISLSQSCVIGSVFFEDYQSPGSVGNIRGKQAIESLVNIAKKGCKAAFVIGQGTEQKFIDDLKEKLSTLGDAAENIVWRSQKEPGYSDARREAILLARSAYPETRAFIMQEIEKDLTENYQDFLDALSDGKALVMMNRGVNVPFSQNPWPDADHLGANLPPEQFWGERHQNIVMAVQEKKAGLIKKDRVWDRLNGTRIIRNEPMKIGNVFINPSDLMLLKYEYSDGYDEADRVNKIDTYSASVYNIIPLMEAMGAEDLISEVPVKYWHPDQQKNQEMSPEVRLQFKHKRLMHKVDLPRINFDIISNIQEWRKDGDWPTVVLTALRSGGVLKIKHFKS